MEEHWLLLSYLNIYFIWTSHNLISLSIRVVSLFVSHSSPCEWMTGANNNYIIIN